jgi:hypothetical protein
VRRVQRTWGNFPPKSTFTSAPVNRHVSGNWPAFLCTQESEMWRHWHQLANMYRALKLSRTHACNKRRASQPLHSPPTRRRDSQKTLTWNKNPAPLFLGSNLPPSAACRSSQFSNTAIRSRILTLGFLQYGLHISSTSGNRFNNTSFWCPTASILGLDVCYHTGYFGEHVDGTPICTQTTLGEEYWRVCLLRPY